MSPLIRDVSSTMKMLLTRLGVSNVIIESEYEIEGRSWEMACVMAAVGHSGVYSGIVSGIDGAKITFGPIAGLSTKRKLGYIKTYYDVPEIVIPTI